MTIIHLITKAKVLEEGKDYVVEDIFDTMPFIEVELPDGQTSVEILLHHGTSSPTFHIHCGKTASRSIQN